MRQGRLFDGCDRREVRSRPVTNAQCPIPNTHKTMQNSAFNQATQVSKLAAATESMALQLTEFIDFIQHHNPETDRVAATQTAAFFLQDLRTAFLEEPEMMQQLRAIALHFSQL